MAEVAGAPKQADLIAAATAERKCSAEEAMARYLRAQEAARKRSRKWYKGHRAAILAHRRQQRAEKRSAQ